MASFELLALWMENTILYYPIVLSLTFLVDSNKEMEANYVSL